MFKNLVLMNLVWQEQEAEISRLFPGFLLVCRGDFQKYWCKLRDLETCVLFIKVMQAFWNLESPKDGGVFTPTCLKACHFSCAKQWDCFQSKTQDTDRSTMQWCRFWCWAYQWLLLLIHSLQHSLVTAASLLGGSINISSFAAENSRRGFGS